METLRIIFPLFLLLVPFFLVTQIIAGIFSQSVRQAIARNRTAYLVWLLVSVAIVLYVLLLPPLKHQRPSTQPDADKAGSRFWPV